MNLRRLVLEFKPGGVVEARILYRRQSGPNPGTKARRREAAELARAGLVQACEAFAGDVEDIGTAGFETREDTFLCTGGAATGVHKKPTKRSAA